MLGSSSTPGPPKASKPTVGRNSVYQKEQWIPATHTHDDAKSLLLLPYYSNITFQNQRGNQAKKNSTRNTELRLWKACTM